jgi:thioredoxin-dependent peroxiredoxin
MSCVDVKKSSQMRAEYWLRHYRAIGGRCHEAVFARPGGSAGRCTSAARRVRLTALVRFRPVPPPFHHASKESPAMLKFIGSFLACLLGTAAVAGAAEPKVGDPAPDFSLVGTDGMTYKLSDFKGKSAVVVAWFPKADTPGCTTECKNISAEGSKLKAYNVAYFTASVDQPAANKAFSDKFSFNFPILSDPSKQTAEAYGLLSPRGVASRWTIYVGKDGKLLMVDKMIKTGSATADIVANLEKLGVEKK